LGNSLHYYYYNFRLHKAESDEKAESPKIRYSCLQFIQRSDSLLQIKTSPLNDRPDRALCTNSSSPVLLDPWLIVDLAHLLSPISPIIAHPGGSSQLHCSALWGGFSVRISGRSRHGESSSSCDGSVLDEVRLETNCVVGTDSLTFYFRRSECAPPELYVNGSKGGIGGRDDEWGGGGARFGGKGGVRQSFLCLADWTERQYKFVVIRHEQLPYVWVLRTATRLIALDESFTTYILADLVALTTNYVTHTDSAHLRFDVVRNIRRPVTSLCIDEDDSACGGALRDICSPGLVDVHGVPLALTCARSCGVCNATRPTICTFPAEWVGEWTDAWSEQKIAVNQSVLGFETSGVREFYHCVQWDRPRPSSPSSTSWTGSGQSKSVDVMLVAGYNNGCRPRYLCARVLKKSTSILYFRFSQVLTWPLTHSVTAPIDCRLFVYDVDATGPADDSLRTKHFRLLYSRQPRPPAHCHLPTANTLSNLSVAFSDGSRCDSASLTDTNGKTGIALRIPGCRTSVLIPTTYDCIMSSRRSSFGFATGVDGFRTQTNDLRNVSGQLSNFKSINEDDKLMGRIEYTMITS